MYAVVDAAGTHRLDGVHRHEVDGLGLALSDRHGRSLRPAYERCISAG
jgi:hypothetical protein